MLFVAFSFVLADAVEIVADRSMRNLPFFKKILLPWPRRRRADISFGQVVGGRSPV